MGKIAAPPTLSSSPVLGLAFGLLFSGISLSAAVAQTPTAQKEIGPASGPAIAISCGSVGIEFQVCSTGADAWAKATGQHVSWSRPRTTANERLALYQQLLAAGSGDIDVFQIDVVWPGILGNHFIDLRDVWTRGAGTSISRRSSTNDASTASSSPCPGSPMPGLLYYRKDLLEKYGRKPPETWQE